jgi:hypothetical protein
MIIKHILNTDDWKVMQQTREKIYLQYFVGMSSFQAEAPFEASLPVRISKRLGKEAGKELNIMSERSLETL